jgi:hypothetical protein
VPFGKADVQYNFARLAQNWRAGNVACHAMNSHFVQFGLRATNVSMFKGKTRNMKQLLVEGATYHFDIP